MTEIHKTLQEMIRTSRHNGYDQYTLLVVAYKLTKQNLFMLGGHKGLQPILRDISGGAIRKFNKQPFLYRIDTATGELIRK